MRFNVEGIRLSLLLHRFLDHTSPDLGTPSNCWWVGVTNHFMLRVSGGCMGTEQMPSMYVVHAPTWRAEPTNSQYIPSSANRPSLRRQKIGKQALEPDDASHQSDGWMCGWDCTQPYRATSVIAEYIVASPISIDHQQSTSWCSYWPSIEPIPKARTTIKVSGTNHIWDVLLLQILCSRNKIGAEAEIQARWCSWKGTAICLNVAYEKSG